MALPLYYHHCERVVTLVREGADQAVPSAVLERGLRRSREHHERLAVRVVEHRDLPQGKVAEPRANGLAEGLFRRESRRQREDPHLSPREGGCQLLGMEESVVQAFNVTPPSDP